MESWEVKECFDCDQKINPNSKDWMFWKYEPNTPLCDGCYDVRMMEEEDE